MNICPFFLITLVIADYFLMCKTPIKKYVQLYKDNRLHYIWQDWEKRRKELFSVYKLCGLIYE